MYFALLVLIGGDRVIMDKLVIGGHTHTDTGDDNTRRPKLALGKNVNSWTIVTSPIYAPVAIGRRTDRFF